MKHQRATDDPIERALGEAFDAADERLRAYRDKQRCDVSIAVYRQRVEALQRAVIAASDAYYAYLRTRRP